MTEEEKWLVNDKYCKGCKYYSTLSASHTSGDKCCDYTFLTGRIRKNPPESCEVKEKGKRPRLYNGTDWLCEKGRKGGKKRG